MKQWALLALGIAFLCPAARAGEWVAYSVTTEQPGPTRMKTEIFALEPTTGRQRFLYSDAGADFRLLPGSSVDGRILAAGSRLFAQVTSLAPNAMGQLTNQGGAGQKAIYELSTDGSNHVRKLFDLERGAEGSNFRNLFADSSGSKIGNTNRVGPKTYLFIHDTATGNLVQKTDIRYGTVERLGWRFGGLENIGWMPDKKRIYFAIEMGGDFEGGLWTSPNSPVGTYVMNEDGEPPQRFAPEAALHPKIAGLQPRDDEPAFLIGVLPNGQYLFCDLQDAPAPSHGGTYLYALDLTKNTQRIFPLQVDAAWRSFHLSPSGRQVFFVAWHLGQQPKPAASSVPEVWILDLESGKQSKLSFTTPNATGSRQPSIGLIGWLADQ
jgi:hypothetical protein